MFNAGSNGRFHPRAPIIQTKIARAVKSGRATKRQNALVHIILLIGIAEPSAQPGRDGQRPGHEIILRVGGDPLGTTSKPLRG
jgi:hypothetical protein